MSTSIDERIVKLSFDNKQFESGAQSALSTLDKLKKSLDFFGVSDALKGFGKVDSSDMEKFGTATENVSSKFSILEKIATGALLKIGSNVADVTMGLLNQVNPLNQVSEGWGKYAEKTGSVQTIMSATRETWEKSAEALGFEGTQMEFVNDQLSKLNWFTDETSYNFTDMVSNIGKFTNNNVPLEQAVTSMQGIATWAGLSGANVQEASRAMYNFSQAMGAGAMKLQDWKSIENANMATTEFKQTAIDTAIALGTLKKVQDGVYKVADTGDTFGIESFNTQLKTGWFDKAVMQKTLETFGGFTDKLYEFSDLTSYDTTSDLIKALDDYKEASGDAEKQTKILQEAIKGTSTTVEEARAKFEELNSAEYDTGKRAFKAAQEAKTFQEAIDSVKDAASTAWMRVFESIFGNYEEAKKLWTALANSLWDMFVGPVDQLASTMEAWKELGGRTELFDGLKALGEVFGSIVEALTAGMEEFDSDKMAEKLYDLTKRFKEWAEAIEIPQPVLDKLSDISTKFFEALDRGKGILKDALHDIVTFAKNVGEGISYFAKQVKETEGFKNFVKVIGDFKEEITKIGNGVIERFVKFFDRLAGIDFNKINFNPFVNAFSKLFDVLAKVGSGVLPVIDWLADKIANFFDAFMEIDIGGFLTVSDTLDKRLPPLQSFFEGLKAIVGGVVDFFKAAAPIFSSLLGIVGEGLKNLGHGLSEAVRQGDYSTIMDFVNSGLLFGIATAVSNFVKKLTDSVTGSEGIIGQIKGLFGSLKEGIDKLVSNGEDTADLLIKMAIAIGILTASALALASVDSEKLTSALVGLTTEMAELVYFTKALDGTRVQKCATAMIAFGIAIALLTSSVKSLAELNTEQTIRGVVAIGALMAALTLVAKSLTDDSFFHTERIMKGVTGLIAFAAAIRLLAESVKELSALNWDELARGLVSVGVLCAEVAAFLKIVGSDGMSIGQGLSLVALAGSISILADAVRKFGELAVEQVIQGLVAIGALLTEIAIFIKLTSGTEGMMSASVALLAIAAAMVVFGNAISHIGSLPIPVLIEGLVGIGVALGILVVAMKSMEGSLAGAAALVVVVGAINLLVPAIALLGSLSVGTIAKAVLGLAASLGVLGAAAVLLTPVAPTILAIAAALALISAAMVGVATAFGLIFPIGDLFQQTADAMKRATGGIGTDMKLLGIAVVEIIKLLPNLVIALVESIGEIVAAIFSSTADIVRAFTDLGSALIESARVLGPQLITAAVECLEQLLQTIVEHGPSIIEKAVTIVLMILDALRVHVPQITAFVVDTLIALVNTINEHLPRFIQAGIDLVVGLIDGLANGLEQNRERLLAAIEHLFEEMVETVLVFLGIHSPSTVFRDIGINMIEGAIEGINEMISSAIDTVVDIVNSMIDSAREKASEFIDVGRNAIEGFVDGIRSRIGDAVNAAVEVARSAWDGVKNFLDINSPSRKMAELGGYTTEGLAKGMIDNLGVVDDAGTEVAKTSLDSIREALANADIALDDSLNPTITPVLDLSNVEEGAGVLSNLLNAGYTTSLGASLGNVSTMSPYDRLASSLNGITGGDTVSYGNIAVNVYAQPGQDARAIADATLDRLNREIKRKRAAFA